MVMKQFFITRSHVKVLNDHVDWCDCNIKYGKMRLNKSLFLGKLSREDTYTKVILMISRTDHLS